MKRHVRQPDIVDLTSPGPAAKVAKTNENHQIHSEARHRNSASASSNNHVPIIDLTDSPTPSDERKDKDQKRTPDAPFSSRLSETIRQLDQSDQPTSSRYADSGRPSDKGKGIFSRLGGKHSDNRSDGERLRGFAHDLPGPDVFDHPSDRFRRRLAPDPDPFSMVADYLCQNYEHNTTDQTFQKLDQSIAASFNGSRQTRGTLEKKLELWRKLNYTLRNQFDCGLFIFGSTFNGFGNDKSDVDLVVFMDDWDPKSTLKRLRNIFQNKCRQFIRGNIEFIPAKVPILKFHDDVGHLDVDMCINNPTSVRNTHLLYYYTRCDHRLRPLVMALKKWARRYNLNEAKNQTLSSYTLALMMINFLQIGCSPRVLPCLQSMYPDIFNPNSDLGMLNYLETPNFTSSNTQNLGQLMADFFRYYSHHSTFDPERDVVSVRTGRVLVKNDCENYARAHNIGPGQWNAFLLVEEPFERTNAARAVCSKPKWLIVHDVFKATSRYLERRKKSDVSLKDLLGLKIGGCDRLC